MPDLALRNQCRWQRCHACGRSLPDHEFVKDDMCFWCWLRHHIEFEEAESDRIFAALARRVRVGHSLGNGRNVAYPIDLDHRLRRLLDSLRHYVIQVRVTLAADEYHVPEGGEVVEGHLRRQGRTCDSDNTPCPWADALSVFRNVEDRVSLRSLYFFEVERRNDYERIAKVECIDPLLLRDRDPVVVWEATEERRAAWAASRARSFDRERLKAKLCVAHVAVVLASLAAVLIPCCLSIHRRQWANAATQFVLVVAVFVASGFTIAFWGDNGPDLSVLWRRRKRTGRRATLLPSRQRH